MTNLLFVSYSSNRVNVALPINIVTDFVSSIHDTDSVNSIHNLKTVI
ncbi:Uncharacterised protein [Streptococcus pneumoniae]|nr:Uncharacterised protein [Streptococcus pneumoniae]